MKPEHFLYKSDGLYYMQNMPVVPDDRDAESLGAYSEMMRQYYKSIARAKSEAVKVDDNHSVVLQSRIVMSLPAGQYELIEGQIYTINMDEKIEVIEEPEFPGFDHTSHPTFRKIARIVAPKKQEESEDEFIAYIESLKNQSFEGWNKHAVSGYNTALLSLYQKYVEIKRKPL